MKGAIFFSTKYGSTKQYAYWISEATGLPAYNVNDTAADLSKYDFLILGSPIIYFKIHFRQWVKKNWSTMEHKPILFFTVSGAPGGDKLNGWIANSDLPKNFISKMKHVALQGRQNPKELTWFDWMMLRIGGMTNKDPQAKKDELEGFDYMDKSSIQPIVAFAKQFKENKMVS